MLNKIKIKFQIFVELLFWELWCWCVCRLYRPKEKKLTAEQQKQQRLLNCLLPGKKFSDRRVSKITNRPMQQQQKQQKQQEWVKILITSVTFSLSLSLSFPANVAVTTFYQIVVVVVVVVMAVMAVMLFCSSHLLFTQASSIRQTTSSTGQTSPEATKHLLPFSWSWASLSLFSIQFSVNRQTFYPVNAIGLGESSHSLSNKK